MRPAQRRPEGAPRGGKPAPVRPQPQRRCIGCGAVRPKRELVRLVRTPDQRLVLDVTGRQPGRGAYVCPQPECIRQAVRRQSFGRAFRQHVTAAEAAALEAAVQAHLGTRESAATAAREAAIPSASLETETP